MESPLVTIYSPKSMGGDIGICAVINTPRGPLTLMARGEKSMLTDYQHLAMKWAAIIADRLDPALVERVIVAIKGAVQNKLTEASAKESTQSPTPALGAEVHSANVAFDLAEAYERGSRDAANKVADYQTKAQSGHEGAKKALMRLQIARAGNQVVTGAAQGDHRMHLYIDELAVRARRDRNAQFRLMFLARARARALMRPILVLKARASKGEHSAAQQLQAALQSQPELAEIVNDTPAESIYDPRDVESQDYEEYGEVSGPLVLHMTHGGEVGAVMTPHITIKDRYADLRKALSAIFNGS